MHFNLKARMHCDEATRCARSKYIHGGMASSPHASSGKKSMHRRLPPPVVVEHGQGVLGVDEEIVGVANVLCIRKEGWGHKQVSSGCTGRWAGDELHSAARGVPTQQPASS